MIIYKRLSFIFLVIYILPFVLPFVLLGCQVVENPVYSHQQMVGSPRGTVLDMFEEDPVMNLLGKSFEQIKQVLGEPDEQGYSGWLGPHYYILYQYKEGAIRFCSPEGIEYKIAVSIILGSGQEVLGAKVGMLFPEIEDILGAPDYGPERDMDDLYHMGYIFGEMNNQVLEVLISFSADSVNSLTDTAFIKWDGFEYDQFEQDQMMSSCEESYIRDVPISIATGIACKKNIKQDILKVFREAENNMYKQTG